jgi:hypothetical protein
LAAEPVWIWKTKFLRWNGLRDLVIYIIHHPGMFGNHQYKLVASLLEQNVDQIDTIFDPDRYIVIWRY